MCERIVYTLCIDSFSIRRHTPLRKEANFATVIAQINSPEIVMSNVIRCARRVKDPVHEERTRMRDPSVLRDTF